MLQLTFMNCEESWQPAGCEEDLVNEQLFEYIFTSLSQTLENNHPASD